MIEDVKIILGISQETNQDTQKMASEDSLGPQQEILLGINPKTKQNTKKTILIQILSVYGPMNCTILLVNNTKGPTI